MRSATILAVAQNIFRQRLMILAVGLILGTLAAADDPAVPISTGAMVNFYATVSAVREVPTGSPMPGTHFDAQVNGQATDIYAASVASLSNDGPSFSPGEKVHVIGSKIRSGGTDIVVARELTAGVDDQQLLYPREDDAPIWTLGR